MCHCNVGLLHDNRWSLCLCNILWWTFVSCHNECCSDDIFLLYFNVSAEYAACLFTILSSTWMLQIQAADFFVKFWINRGHEKVPDQFIVPMCVIMFHWKQRPYFLRNCRCKLKKIRHENTECSVNCLLLFHTILYAVKLNFKSCVIM